MAALIAVAALAAAAVSTPGVVVTAFPDRDFLNITGYPTTSKVTIDVVRNGAVIGTTGAVTPPATGFDLNHGAAGSVAGIDCWGRDARPRWLRRHPDHESRWQQRHVDGIIAYSGLNTVTPCRCPSGAATTTTSGTSVTAPGITTTRANTQVVGFFGIGAATTFSGAQNTTLPAGMAERFDVAANNTFKVSLAGFDMSQATATATGDKIATAVAAAGNIGSSWP